MLNTPQLPAKLPTLHDEKKAEELLISNAAMKKRQLELEEEVCASIPMAHQAAADSACAGEQAEAGIAE